MMSTKVTARDMATGESETVTIPDDDFVLICGPDRYLASTVAHVNGTTVLTIKAHKPVPPTTEGEQT